MFLGTRKCSSIFCGVGATGGSTSVCTCPISSEICTFPFFLHEKFVRSLVYLFIKSGASFVVSCILYFCSNTTRDERTCINLRGWSGKTVQVATVVGPENTKYSENNLEKETQKNIIGVYFVKFRPARNCHVDIFCVA